MATRPTLFRFCASNHEGGAEWESTYPIPSSLFVPGSVQNTPLFKEQFRAALLSIMPQLQPECDSKAGTICVNCNNPSSTSKISPSSYLHVPNEPFIMVFVQPICSEPECSLAAQRIVDVTMDQAMEEARDEDARLKKCDACWETGGLKKCTKCKSVAYCGTECQKKAWKHHKKECAQLAQRRLGAQ
ncbi:hypothetical protein FB567DRAFT_547188 [Paraphoma chrysanthemicola]|uniref:MYND-type domain-containing protein n=1 Tax=Paraphoma chrysanthemicola TaxID=798071 RepID=A0A8K0VZW1_9PLEO|nr:hypothetical protein FB567DRAFT_547188 [Paraphoma chrysanthemicola]